MKKSYLTVVALCILLLIAIAFGYSFLFSKKTPSGNNEISNTNIDSNAPETNNKNKIVNNKLSDFDMFFLKSNNQETNKVLSPMSIKNLMGMTSIGSDGNSKLQIDNILGEYNFKNYSKSKNLSIANAFFMKDTFAKNINTDYVKNVENKFGAEIKFDPFSNAQNINKWISNNTFNLIDNLIDDATVQKPDTNFITANTIAIDMDWKNSIQPDKAFLPNYSGIKLGNNINPHVLPHEGKFKTFKFNDKEVKTQVYKLVGIVNKYDIIKNLGKEKILDTLNKNGITGDTADEFVNNLYNLYGKVNTSTDFSFFSDDKVKIFAKDLKEYEGTNLQYIGIMPKSENLKSFIDKNDASSISKLLNELKDFKSDNFKDNMITIVNGFIPGFEFSYELKLKDNLKELGITDIFDQNKANLSKIAKTDNNNKLYISDAKHKSNITFSNKGIKAVAASATVGELGSAMNFEFDVPVEIIDITFDKPFLFLIRDKNTEEIWFIGTVYSPVEE